MGLFLLKTPKGFFLLTGFQIWFISDSPCFYLINCFQIWFISDGPCFYLLQPLLTGQELTMLQVIILTADADCGPKAQVLLPKEYRTPNNITCFFLYPETQYGICFLTASDFKEDVRWVLFIWPLGIKLILSEYCSKQRLRDCLTKKIFFTQFFSLWHSLVYPLLQHFPGTTGS